MSHMAVMSLPDFDIPLIMSEDWFIDGLAHPARSTAPIIELKNIADVMFMIRPLKYEAALRMNRGVQQALV